MRCALILLPFLPLVAWPAAAQEISPTSMPLTQSTAASTGDITSPEVILRSGFRGVCVYVLDNAAGATTFNLRMQVGTTASTYTTWLSGASKAVVNEATTCFYPVTFTGPVLYAALVADVVVTGMPSRFRILIDKTAAVNTQFDLFYFPIY